MLVDAGTGAAAAGPTAPVRASSSASAAATTRDSCSVRRGPNALSLLRARISDDKAIIRPGGVTSSWGERATHPVRKRVVPYAGTQMPHTAAVPPGKQEMHNARSTIYPAQT